MSKKLVYLGMIADIMHPGLINIINEGANVLLYNLEELDSVEGKYEGVYEVLTKCVYYINRDFDHEVSLAEYAEMSGELVEEISGCLGEFFA